MSKRITHGVERPAATSILINGKAVEAYEGESVLTALIAADVLIMSHDTLGRARTPFCNMGVCFECLVDVQDAAGVSSRVRACLAPVRAGMRVTVAE